ncbi:hypothetical protein JCM10207_005909 [Rhodosporidiobolus poonsookiae]
MLAVEPAFLPLQPLPASLTAMATPVALSQAPPVPFDLPLSCSISALRYGFTPFPVRPVARPRLSFVDLPLSPDAATPGGDSGSFASELVVRPVKRADVERVRRLQEDCLPVSYPPSFYSILLTNPSSLCLVAYSPSSPSTILGAVSASVDFTPDSFSASTAALPSVYVLSLAVSPSARNRGLASHLLRAVCKALLPCPPPSPVQQRVRVKLHVESSNTAALRLYKRMGLVEKGRRRGFYRRLRNGGSGEAVEMEGVLRV